MTLGMLLKSRDAVLWLIAFVLGAGSFLLLGIGFVLAQAARLDDYKDAAIGMCGPERELFR